MRKRNSWAARRESRHEIGRVRGLASQRVQRVNRASSRPDAETAMRRALDDARGQKIDEGRDWIGGKERHWLIRRSLHGRTNQVDLVINGTLWRTGALAMPAMQSSGASGLLLPRASLQHLSSSRLLQLMKRFLLLAILPASALLAQTPDPETELMRLAAAYERSADNYDRLAFMFNSQPARAAAVAMRTAADMAKDVAAKFPAAPVVVVPQNPEPPRTTPLAPETKPPVKLGPALTRPLAVKQPARLSILRRR